MPSKENAILDEGFYCLRHYGWFVFPRVWPRGVKAEWPVLDPKHYVGVAWRANSGAVRMGKHFVRFGGAPGLGDIQGWEFKGGRFLNLEGKTATGKTNKDQTKRLALSEKTGSISGIFRCYADVEAIMKKWGFERR